MNVTPDRAHKASRPKQSKPSLDLTLQHAEKVALSLTNIKENAVRLAALSEDVRRCIEAVENSVRLISSISGDPEGAPDRDKIHNRCERLRELRNEMELGSFSIQVNQIIENAWRRLP